MKTLPRRLLTALVPLSLVLTLQAQPGPRDGDGPRRGPGRMGPPVIRALDVDRDREISAAELAQAAASLRTLDANQDGQLSSDELHPVPPSTGENARPPREDAGSRPDRGPKGPQGPEGARPLHPVMLALDADQDGVLSSGEISRASASLAALDENKDGKLSGEELRPLPPTGNAGR